MDRWPRFGEWIGHVVPRGSVSVRTLACCRSLARYDARDMTSQRNGMALAKGRTMQWPRNGPLGLMCRAEDREDLLSSRQEDGGGAADPPPAGINGFNMHAMEGDGRRRDCRMMRSGKAEDAMRAAGMVGIRRQFRRVLRIGGKARKPVRYRQHLHEGKSRQPRSTGFARRSHMRQRSGQRSRRTTGLNAQSEYAAHANGTIDPAIAALHQLTTEQILHNAIDAKCPSGGSD